MEMRRGGRASYDEPQIRRAQRVTLARPIISRSDATQARVTGISDSSLKRRGCGMRFGSRRLKFLPLGIPSPRTRTSGLPSAFDIPSIDTIPERAPLKETAKSPAARSAARLQAPVSCRCALRSFHRAWRCCQAPPAYKACICQSRVRRSARQHRLSCTCPGSLGLQPGTGRQRGHALDQRSDKRIQLARAQV
jgi:hypothetical protein